MFQYAFARSLSLRTGELLKFRVDFFDIYKNRSVDVGNAFNLKILLASDSELSNIVGNIRASRHVRLLLSKKYFALLRGGNFICEDNIKKNINGKYHACSHGYYLQGYWQSEKYFEDHFNVIHNDFRFRINITGTNKVILDFIRNNKAIGIHVRRGDYLAKKSIHVTCSVDYFISATRYICNYFPEAVPIIFTDDPVWVRSEFLNIYPNAIVVDGNQGSNSYIDMMLMSQCHHNVISNSTFSWWAAWLNTHKDKIVIAPKKWYLDAREINNLIPTGWIIL